MGKVWLWTLPLLLLAATPVAAQPAAREAPPPDKTVRVNGIDLHYREYGSGPPLLLLHGFGGCSEAWAPFVEGLARDHRVIVPDLRGHGWSTNRGGTFTMRQSSEDIVALLDRLGLARVKAMGISAGGMTLLHLATRWPERIDRMVLIGASSHFPDQAREVMRSVVWEQLPPDVRQVFTGCAWRGEAQARSLVRLFNGFQNSRDDVNFAPAELGRIKARTLIVHGDRDIFFPVGIAAGMYQAIPASALWIVPEGDHVPIYDAQAPEFLRVARAFLVRPEPAASD